MKKAFLFFTLLLTLACSTPVAFRQPTATNPAEPSPVASLVPPAAPAEPLITPESILPPPTATHEGRSEAGIPLPYNENILISLADSACEARWSNNLTHFSCPGDRSAIDGAALFLDQPSFSYGKVIRNKTLLTIPGYGSNGSGIFGHYPARLIEHEKTHFMAGLTCLSLPCQAEFGLGYYDQAGKYYDLISWQVDSERFTEEYGPWDEVDYDLSPFLNQTIELVLVVRNLPNTRVEALWVEPMLYLKY